MRYGFVRPEGMRARLLNALPLLYMSAILLNVQEKMSALSAFTPPPPYEHMFQILSEPGAGFAGLAAGVRCAKWTQFC